MTHAGFSLQLGINRGGQQGPAPVDLGAGRRVLRRAANELLGLVFHGVPFPPVIRAVRQVSPWQGDGPDFPAVSLRTSGLDLRGDGTDARSYIRDRRQQFTGHRCSRRGLADQEHRRISCVLNLDTNPELWLVGTLSGRLTDARRTPRGRSPNGLSAALQSESPT